MATGHLCQLLDLHLPRLLLASRSGNDSLRLRTFASSLVLLRLSHQEPKMLQNFLALTDT